MGGIADPAGDVSPIDDIARADARSSFRLLPARRRAVALIRAAGLVRLAAAGTDPVDVLAVGGLGDVTIAESAPRIHSAPPL